MREIKTEWDLEKYYFDSLVDERIQEGIDKDLKKLEEYIVKYKGRIANLSPEEFLEFLQNDSKLFTNMTKVHYYHSYLSTLNTQDQEVLKKSGEMSNLWASVSESLLFLDEEYKEIGYDRFMEMSSMDMFRHYSNNLVQVADGLKYMLSEAQEKNLIEINKVVSIFDDIYSELTNSFDFDFRGEKKTKSEIYALRLSEDESIRKDANNSLLEKYAENKIVLGNLYKSVCKENVARIKMRGLDGVMHMRNTSEQMEEDVVNTLLDTVKSNYHLYHKHLKNKARMLGKEKLELHDVLAPIPGEAKKTFSFEEGLELYLENVKKFDQEFYDYSVKIFEEGRVSVFPKQGKMGGAYASYNKDKESFVMLNHTEDFDSIMTLGHEIGHAIHGNLSQVQVKSVYHSPLSLAETASIFNETLIFEEIMKGVSEEDREYYIMKNLDDMFSTMFRQVMYVDFERECHQRTLDGEELSYDDFNQIWLEKTKDFFGDAVDVSDLAKHGWSVIPHIFHTPFYCYAYSFGNILSFNLYKMYKDSDDKEAFKNMYKGILRSGGSKRPKELLLENGIDISSAEFYTQAFKVIEEFIKMTE